MPLDIRVMNSKYSDENVFVTADTFADFHRTNLATNSSAINRLAHIGSTMSDMDNSQNAAMLQCCNAMNVMSHLSHITVLYSSAIPE